MKKFALSLVAALLVCAHVFASGSSDTASAGGAAAWPKKTVQIIVPFGAGGDTDFNARILAEKLSKNTGETFVVVNMAGNGGATASRYVKDAANDGNTILFYQSAFVINQLSGMTDYGLEAFEFVGVTGRSAGQIITVNSKYGMKNLADLIAYTKSHPGELKMAANTGATTHATALLLRNVGAQFNIVDSGSSTERIASLLGGHVDIIVNPYNTIKDYLATGELTGLALDIDEQPNTIPDIKIGKLQGYDIGLPYYYFMAFPKGTDAAIVSKLSSLLENIIKTDSDYAQKILKGNLQEPAFYGSKEGSEMMKAAYEKLSKLNFKK
jgi:tripartite-type tricarboxylate transporter receptor subunit TctC